MADIRGPITSYGIILFHRDSTGELWYLLSQRRDTIEYTDFLRGKYSLEDLDNSLALMTPVERQRLKNHTFDELWDDLWINHESYFYKTVKESAREKFEHNREIMLERLERTTSRRSECGWGFPKGKRNPYESDIQCAYREFAEETRMSLTYLNLLNLVPAKETFQGTNRKMYRTIYYLARVDHKIPIRKIPIYEIRRETISEEISNLRWCKIEEAMGLLPLWRQKMLLEVDSRVRRYLEENEEYLRRSK